MIVPYGILYWFYIGTKTDEQTKLNDFADILYLVCWLAMIFTRVDFVGFFALFFVFFVALMLSVKNVNGLAIIETAVLFITNILYYFIKIF